MPRSPSRILMAVSLSLPVRLEVAKTIRVIVAQDKEEKRLRRGAEFVAIRRDCDLIVEVIRGTCRQLRKAGFNPDEPRVQAGNPDGGQWTIEGASGTASASRAVVSDATRDSVWISGTQYAANDPPSSGQGPSPDNLPDVPPEQPATRQAVNAFLKAAAYWAAEAIIVDEPLGLAFLETLQAVDWLSSYLPYIEAYLDAPKTLEELQQAALNPAVGYNIHHIVEQTPAAQDGFSWSQIDAPENLVRVSTLVHWEINGWYGRLNESFGGVSPREYLKGKSWDERMRVGKDALILFGVLEP